MKPVSLLLALLALSACEKTPTTPTQYQHTIITFGTLLEVTLSGISPELAETAFNLLENDYRDYHNAWTPWQDSDLTRINSAFQDGKKVIPAPTILPLIQHSISLSKDSNGHFNPSIGNLITLWQFHKHDDPNIKPPNSNDIKRLILQKPHMSDITFSDPYLSSKNPNVQLNFGAYAKGYAIELSFKRLKNLGIHNAIINAGGDLKVSGSHGARLWNIGIKHPRNDGVIASIEVKSGESIFTSGDYERNYIYQNKRYHHIIDPDTGYPTIGTSSVTVIHSNAAVADAAATAILVAGPSKWHEVAKNMGIHYVMLIEENGTIHMNPSMTKRIQLKDLPKPSIVLSQPL